LATLMVLQAQTTVVKVEAVLMALLLSVAMVDYMAAGVAARHIAL